MNSCNNDEQIMQMIERNKRCCRPCFGPTGATGPTGPSGTQKLGAAFLVTFDDNNSNGGIEVLPNGRIPIDRVETDTNNICELNINDNTIQFNKTGVYRIDITINARVPYETSEFNPETDFVSIGFRKVDDSVIYAGESNWIYDEYSQEIVANGVFEVDSIATPYELVNFSDRHIYLDSPGIENIGLDSYFLNPVVTILIQELGK